MQQMKTWGAMAMRLLAFNLVTFLAVGPAFGQTGQVVHVTVPYEFTFGLKLLPAGTYTFSETPWGLQAQPATGKPITVHILARLGGPTEFLRDGSLVFDKTGGSRILSEVWMPGTDGMLVHSNPKSYSREIFIFSPVLNQNPNLSGRVAYDRTCGKCHGPDGKGDERADKFFKIAIPRLSSAKVQSKSDEELREIITKGTRAMPTVEIDESGFRHGLAHESVDSVIAYVRTLKQ